MKSLENNFQLSAGGNLTKLFFLFPFSNNTLLEILTQSAYKNCNSSPGIIQRLDHFTASNIDAIWLSPIYRSPMVDFGYDIANFTEIDPIFGNLEDFQDLVNAAHDKNLLLLMDFVPNHTSDKHEWFQKSLQGIKPYDNYYVWHQGRTENGTRKPPNNWVSVI